jgi:N-acetylmuramoyl-L-alanine amidase
VPRKPAGSKTRPKLLRPWSWTPDTAGKTAAPTIARDRPEKVVTLDVAQRLERKLRESQLKTVMTRSSDTFIPLDQRVSIENSQKNAIFVSIHFNDSRRRGIRGFETYYNSGVSLDLATGFTES